MTNLKTVSEFILVLLNSLIVFQTVITADQTTWLPNNNTSSISTCSLNVIPLHYEINIGPVKNSTDPVFVSCWLKIKAEIGKNDCTSTTNNNSDTFISLNSRNCKLDIENITVSKSIIGKQTQLLRLKNFAVGNKVTSDELPVISTQYTLQFDIDQLNVKDQILFHVPYQIELKRDYPKDTWQGLYYYDPSDNNDTDLLFYFPLHARYIFPIFDNADPFHKPTFKISVARFTANDFVSVSNADILKTVQRPEIGEGWVVDHFRESPPMKIDQVTLLLLRGFQNHTIYKQNLNNNESSEATNLWTMKIGDYTNETIFHSLFEIQRFMDYFNGVFNETKYPLNKIDFIVLPWNIDGMSWQKGNLGIVLGTKLNLLSYSNGNLDESQENSELYEFIAGQIALQWFRGITSPNNEHTQVTLSGETLAYYVMTWVLKYQTEIPPLYIVGSYEIDIANLLTMMENAFSRKVLQDAITQVYLPKTVQHGTFPSNLWRAIQLSVEFHNKTDILPSDGKNGTVGVTDIFDSWTNNMYQNPIIKINEAQNETGSIELHQTYTKTDDVANQNWWWVPVNISTGNGSALIWISPNNTLVNSSRIYRNPEIIDSDDGWIFVNPEQRRYFDVEYSDHLLKNIINQLGKNHSVFPATGRKDLIVKQFTLARKDNKWETLEMALEMTKYLGKEMDTDVWGNSIWAVGMFNGKFMEQPSTFQVYFGQKINNVLRNIGLFPKLGEEINVAELRLLLMKSSIFYEVPLFVENASELMTKWMENSTVNPFHQNFVPEVREALYCAAVGNSRDDSVVKFLYTQLANYNLSSNLNDIWNEAKQICKALACVRNDLLLESLLGNNSKLANVKDKVLQTCYQQYIPFEILWRRPIIMMDAVYDFWMKYSLKEHPNPGNGTDEIDILMPWSYEPTDFLESMKYTNLREYVQFFNDDSLENRENSMKSITWMFKEIEGTFDERYNKAEKWFARNL